MNWNNKDINQVALQTIWCEHINKEGKHRIDKEDFSINPKNLKKSTLSAPVSSRQKRFLDKDNLLLEAINRRLKGSTAGSTFQNETKMPAHLEKTLRSVHDAPKDKYPYPVTEAQEAGWLSEPLIKEAGNSRFHHPRTTCEITAFAADIIGASGIDPFKQKSGP